MLVHEHKAVTPFRHADLVRAGEAALHLGRRADFGYILSVLADHWRELGRSDLAREITRYAQDVLAASLD